MVTGSNNIAIQRTWSAPEFPNPITNLQYTWGGTYPPTVSAQGTWSGTSWYWNEMPYYWGDIQIVEEINVVIKGVPNQYGGGGVRQVQQAVHNWQVQNPEKKKKLIKLYCKVMGQKYEASKYKKDFTLSTHQVKLVINEVLNRKKKITVSVILNE